MKNTHRLKLKNNFNLTFAGEPSLELNIFLQNLRLEFVQQI